MSTSNALEKYDARDLHSEIEETSQPTTPKRMDQPRITALDGLRGFAFLSVFVFHLGKIPGYTRGPVLVYNEVIGWGFLGVDLFFVISGFIITTLLLDEKLRNNTINIKLFFQRRALRIWPLFYLTLSLSIAGAVIFAKKNFDANLLGTVLREVYLRLAFFFYMVPRQAAEQIGQLAEQTSFPITHCISPLWSICVEEQFYLIWPVVLAFVRTRRQLLIALLIAVACCEYCRATGVTGLSSRFYENPVSRIPPLAIGALIAIGDHSRNRLYDWLCRHAGWLFALTSVIGVIVMCGTSRNGGIFLVQRCPDYLMSVIALGGILFAVLKGDFAKKLFSQTWLSELGKLTYCLYLVHFPIVYVTRPFEWTFIHDNIIRHILWAVISFSISFAIAKVSWRFIEKPLAQLRAKLAC